MNEPQLKSALDDLAAICRKHNIMLVATDSLIRIVDLANKENTIPDGSWLNLASMKDGAAEVWLICENEINIAVSSDDDSTAI